MLTAYLEVWSRTAPRLVPLEGERVTLGKDAANDVVLSADPMVSRLHAVLESYPAGWCVRDLGSRNGTFLNGQRVWREQQLREGDELRLGGSRIVYRFGAEGGAAAPTQVAAAAPELTRREREVLLQLCRPLLSADAFAEPASAREIAKALFVTEAAVKQHLLRLYDKFEIYDADERRRVRLAREAMQRNAVAISELRQLAERGQDGEAASAWGSGPGP